MMSFRDSGVPFPRSSTSGNLRVISTQRRRSRRASGNRPSLLHCQLVSVPFSGPGPADPGHHIPGKKESYERHDRIRPGRPSC